MFGKPIILLATEPDLINHGSVEISQRKVFLSTFISKDRIYLDDVIEDPGGNNDVGADISISMD